MADTYWVFVSYPRWKFLKRFKKQYAVCKVCSYSEVTDFVDRLKIEYPEVTLTIGVTRGENIYVIG